MIPQQKVKIFFVIFLCLLCQPFYILSQTDKHRNFIRIGEDLPISLRQNPAIFYNTDKDADPSILTYTEFNNNFLEGYKKVNANPNWIKVELQNNSDSATEVVAWFAHKPSEMHVLYKNLQGNWIRKKAGILIHATEEIKTSFHASKIILQPGLNTIYFYNADSWKKFPLSFIEFVDPVNFIYQYHLSDETFTYVLFAFLMLLLFQIIYVLFQAFYHNKVEYRAYILYLLCIIIYFTVRYELYFNADIITFGIPGARRLLNDVMLFLPFAFYLRFSRYFIELPGKDPLMNGKIKNIESLIYILTFVFIIGFFTPLRVYESIFLLVLIISLSLYSLRLIWFFFKQRNRQIWFVLAGSLAATTGHFLAMMMSWIPELQVFFNIEPIFFTMTGLVFEIFFFNTGLGYKAKSEQQEKLQAQEKLIMQLNENTRMQQRLETMRNKIASDLHDDVGSTLSSIGLYSEVGIDQIEKNTPYVKGILEKISLSSHRMMTAMNDIVWAIHSEHDEDEGLVERIRHFADERLGPAGIKFSLIIDPSAEKLRFSMEARRNILLIFKEAVNNAAKYSGTTKIECWISVTNQNLEFKINDFGTGIIFPLKHSGNGLTTMKNRAKEMMGKLDILPGKEGGTTISALLPLEEIILPDYKQPS